MNARSLSRTLVLLVTAAVLLAGATPAFARDSRRASLVNTAPALPGAPATPTTNTPVPLQGERGPVPAGVTVAGHAIGGLSEPEARAAIHAYVRPDALPQLDVVVEGKVSTLWPAEAFDVDLAAMLDQAYAATGPTELQPRWMVDTRGVRKFLDAVLNTTGRAPSDARWTVSGKSLKYIPHVVGRRIDRGAARWSVLSALAAEARTGAAQPAIPLAVRTTQPRWTDKNLGKAIIVVISDRTLKLYDKNKVAKTYKCAVGMPGYPTPTGNFHIVEKRYLPSWVNPALDGWGKGMPPVIGPGPGNPLGTRALNLNAPGIRIHGTEKIGSIGTAASHGCMRLVRGDIEELFTLVDVGTPVFIVP